MAKVIQYASPNITLQDWQAGLKSDIDIFEDQLQGWVFDQATALSKQTVPASEHASYALLALTAPYFEMITCYLEGRETPKRMATEFLRRGLSTVLGSNASRAAVQKYVTELRNGIAHELMFRTVVLHHASAKFPSFGIVRYAGADVLAIDPFWLFTTMHDHFKNYVARLRNPTTSADKKLLARFNSFMGVRKSRRP